MTLQAIKYQKGALEILDQLKLPLESVYIKLNDVQDGWEAIRTMKVRGAPAIAIVGCLSLAVDLEKTTFITKDDLKQKIEEKLSYLITARPTAVNIKIAAEELNDLVSKLYKDESIDVDGFKLRFIKAIEVMLDKDVSDNKQIGKFGSEAILSGVTGNVCILTHCNTGSLATAGYGTALGVVRALQESGRLDHVYCTETRPYNQGARLTAYELVYEKIPSTLIVDSMVAALMKSKKISAVLVGADRVVSNGDTANKIGTFQIAIIAKYFNVPFYVAAPTTSIDMKLASGDEIKIEERPKDELTYIGNVRIAAPGTRKHGLKKEVDMASGINCWNPSFDVTPASLITSIITEKGAIPPEKLKEIF